MPETENARNSRRIVSNTLALYGRMALATVTGMYTSRIVLQMLGETDNGIYSVVGSLATMCSFLIAAMSQATQRFLAYDLGERNYPQLSRTFSTFVNIYSLLALLVMLLVGPLGAWWLNSGHPNIPADRLTAANWVFFLTIAMVIIDVLVIPYTSMIIAHERLKVFALVSVADVGLRLAIALMLGMFGYDRMIFFACLSLGVTLLMQSFYVFFCLRNYTECKYRLVKDRQLWRTLLSYAGWNLWGNAAYMTMTTGINIVINMFFMPVVNTARDMAYKLTGALSGLYVNLQMAINPQIIKSYAADNRDFMLKLLFRGAKFSFFLMQFVCLPVIFETDFVLKIWLGSPQSHLMVLFARLAAINTLIDCISGTLMTAAQATGQIKLYQSIIGGLLLLILPVSYLLLWLGYPPQATAYVSICVSVIALFVRIAIVSRLMNMPFVAFIRNTLVPAWLCLALALPLPWWLCRIMEPGWGRFLAVCLLPGIAGWWLMYFIGLTPEERTLLRRKKTDRQTSP